MNRRHIEALSNDIGIMQHAIGPVPDPDHGYCTDDVARALQVDLLHGRELGWAAVADRAWRNMRFLGDAFDPTTGRFRNLRRLDGVWLDGMGSEDCHGRAMLALGDAIAESPDDRMVAFATSLFTRALPEAQALGALRSRASTLLGCDAALRGGRSDAIESCLRVLADRILSEFESAPGAAWPWPEPTLTYENALPPRALIVGGRRINSRPMLEAGLRSLDWLIAVQTAPEGHLSPIGNGWWAEGGERSRFDQQPLEPAALLLAAEAAYRAIGDERYEAVMERCYAWFLGANDVGVDVAVPERGAGHDGLAPRGVNANMGAESTLAWLISLEHVRTMRMARGAGAPPASRRLAVAAR